MSRRQCHFARFRADPDNIENNVNGYLAGSWGLPLKLYFTLQQLLKLWLIIIPRPFYWGLVTNTCKSFSSSPSPPYKQIILPLASMADHLIYKPSQAMQSLSAMERDNINKISNYFLHTCFPVIHLLFVMKMECLGKLWEIFSRILAKKKRGTLFWRNLDFNFLS